MLPSPSSSPPRTLAFNNSTNLPRNEGHKRSQSKSSWPWLQLPTPPKNSKRPANEPNETPSKRVKLTLKEEDESENEERYAARARARFQRRTTNPLNFTCRDSFSNPISRVGSTRPILETFVSSCKSDLFRCDSVHSEQFLTPPYACSYSHSARRGGLPLLAVSTEEGTVHIINTVKRSEWDPEPPRRTLQSHDNGIFDVKWNPSDSYLATCSADKSVRISCPHTSQILHTLNGHTNSVKRSSWHPSNDALLATGGRDGTIFVWDLRVSENSSSPAFSILDAHEPLDTKGRRRNQVPKTVTNLIVNEDMSLISSGSGDGILRCWDLRFLSHEGARRPARSKRFMPTNSSPSDPTMSYGSRRPRGILSLTAGIGPTSGLLFALGADSRIHTYSTSCLAPLPINFTESNMHVNGSFYLSSSISPCGRWLACGGGNNENVFLFDVSSAAKPFARASPGVELKAQTGEVYAVDWADGMVATCADDMTVRVWRPDVEVYRGCLEDPEASKWKWHWPPSRK